MKNQLQTNFLKPKSIRIYQFVAFFLYFNFTYESLSYLLGLSLGHLPPA